LNEITDLEPGDTTARNFAFAVDVGTTTVVAHLIDLRTGQTLGATARYNSQATYGGDVIRRIMWATNEPDGLAKLQSLIVTDINELIHILLNRYHVARGDVSLITAAGNTTMLHMLLGVDPAWIRREPYVGAIYHPPPFRAAEVGLQISPRGLLYCLPSISSYVGADITAGVLATGGHESEKLYLLVDIGTNGEIVVGNRDWSVCASASAGPAFEGTDTRHGMRAARGAIDHVHHIECRRPPSYSTIDSAPPIGICGTGYIDLLAELTRSGLMDKTGRLNVDGECNRIRLGPQEVPEYVLATSNESGNGIDITITQEDIANMVRAKAAIYAAARVLMNSLSLSFEDIREVRMAGAFGNYLNLENAVAIGLLPDLPADRMQFVGNASIHGAKLSALSTEKMQDARTIAAGMTYFELSTDPTFMDEFSAACFFPHTHLEMFPSLNTGK